MKSIAIVNTEKPISQLDQITDLPEVPEWYIEDMGWYELTELSNSFINDLITYCGLQEIEEEGKENPDQDRIKRLDILAKELHAIKRSANLFSHDEMRGVIRRFAPMLRKIDMDGQLV